jgi:glycosyltransferase involved in cell wall biosynthesis
MKISIVTISYNQKEFLRECIDSVLSQDYLDVEYIVVDPGSTDGSRELINSYADRIIRVFERDHGPADGLNRGFAVATGDVFGFINSDDTLLPGALSAVARKFARGNVDVVCGTGNIIDAHGATTRVIASSRMTPWLYVHGGVTVFQQGTFFSADAFRGVGGFNVENGTCWDGELLLDMALSGARFSTIPDRLATFRLHAGSISGSGRLVERYRNDCDRLFRKATGRDRRPLDGLADRAALLG